MRKVERRKRKKKKRLEISFRVNGLVATILGDVNEEIREIP